VLSLGRDDATGEVAPAGRRLRQQQLEYVRINKDLEALLGTRLPEISGDTFKLEVTPRTAEELSTSLGRHDQGRSVRRVLRARYQVPANGTWTPLTDEQVNYVRAHLTPLS